jgi:SAM-dependent methyltransferase
MSAQTDFDLDDTGKIDLSGIYDQPDSRGYYQTLANLDYRIPAAGEPVFRAVIAAQRAARDRRRLTVLDVGCSYGVNAAILKHNCDLLDLFRFYSVRATASLSRRELLARDRTFFKTRVGDGDLRVVGLDTADNAAAYACAAGIMDAAIVADLEAQAPSEPEAELISDLDLVISTGAIGYVGAQTFAHILDQASSKPWFALFALRMFPIDAIAEVLKFAGYEVFRLVGQTFRQRRFASRDEANEVLANLAQLGIDPAGRESEGWYHAEFYFARPAAEAVPAPIQRMVAI